MIGAISSLVDELTLTGFRLSITKLSARIIMNRMNLCERMRSISSAFFTAMLMRIELTELSMSTRSFSLRLITTGLSRSSLLFLLYKKKAWLKGLILRRTMNFDELLDFDLGLVVSLDNSRVEVLHAHGGRQGRPHCIQVRFECGCHLNLFRN